MFSYSLKGGRGVRRLVATVAAIGALCSVPAVVADGSAAHHHRPLMVRLAGWSA